MAKDDDSLSDLEDLVEIVGPLVEGGASSSRETDGKEACDGGVANDDDDGGSDDDFEDKDNEYEE